MNVRYRVELSETARAGGVRKLSGEEEALLVATACSKAPAGCARWTLKLLAGRMVELTEHAQLSRETIRRRLHEKELKPWQRKREEKARKSMGYQS